ncbi:MAG: hypothetical protein HY459_00640 [Parcubacteria group bacterium]|nr:hypothetical protein [Parcubacteria group bacterium]
MIRIVRPSRHSLKAFFVKLLLVEVISFATLIHPAAWALAQEASIVEVTPAPTPVPTPTPYCILFPAAQGCYQGIDQGFNQGTDQGIGQGSTTPLPSPVASPVVIVPAFEPSPTPTAFPSASTPPPAPAETPTSPSAPPTPAPTPTPAYCETHPEAQGCFQGDGQGSNQGIAQGSPTPSSLPIETPSPTSTALLSSPTPSPTPLTIADNPAGTVNPSPFANTITPTPTPTPYCVLHPDAQGCFQGFGQGTHQGAAQGSPNNSLLGVNGIEAENSNTGAGSTNTVETDIDNSAELAFDNTASIVNDADAVASTGSNSASRNTGNGTIDTGNADLTLDVLNITNSSINPSGNSTLNLFDVFGTYTGNLSFTDPNNFANPFSFENIRGTNDATGADSTNTVITSVEDLLRLATRNDGTIDNDFTLGADTGNNTANANTGNANITTGDVNIVANLINLLNSNISVGDWLLAVANIYGSLQGDIVVPQEVLLPRPRTQGAGGFDFDGVNSDTGADSQNDMTTTIDENLTITSDNTALVNNNVTVDAMTGENQALDNTGGGTITTGAVNAKTNVTTFANTNIIGDSWYLVLVNSYGKWYGVVMGAPSASVQQNGATTLISGLIGGENASTGAGSTNSVDTTLTSDRSLETENEGVVNNSLEIGANTGGNTASDNTGLATIVTGDINALTNIVNFVNVNMNVGHWYLAMVNVFGEWNGNLVFEEPSVPAATGSLASGTYGAAQGSVAGSALAANSGTGADSENTVSLDGNRTVTIENMNEATITNVLDVNADTGHNLANRNTGAGAIRTGDAVIESNVNNNANYNLIDATTFGGTLFPTTIAAANEMTGVNSLNSITVSFNDELTITNENTADVDNHLASIANTGENEARKNTGGGSIITGDAIIEHAIENNLNRNTIVVGGEGGVPEYEITLANDATGADSTNTITIDLAKGLEILNENRALVNNDSSSDANTGRNTASANTGAAEVETGNATLETEVANTVNENEVAGLTDVDATVKAINKETGFDSLNTTDVAFDANTDITGLNDATIDNTITHTGNTGENEVNKNTGGKSLLGRMEEFFATLMGSLGGSGANDSTGDDSENETNLGLHEDVTITEVNNADLENHATSITNSGENEANQNTGEATLNTGTVDSGIFGDNTVNQNRYPQAELTLTVAGDSESRMREDEE